MANVLIINAHQFYENFSSGELNRHLVNVMQTTLQANGHTVDHTYIEKGYDIKAEVDKHMWADVIILQTPVYWFGTPWIHKKYVDEVFTEGLSQKAFLVDDGRSRKDPTKQYGDGGLMQGKQFMMSLTWNAPAEAFSNATQRLYRGRTTDDALIANNVCYQFCGATIIPAFSCHDVMKNADVEGDVKRLTAYLTEVFGVEKTSLAV